MGDTCDNTRMFRTGCQCLDCKPEIVDISDLLEGAHNIVDVIERLRESADKLEALGIEGSEIGEVIDDTIVVRREKTEGMYWTRCGNIVQVPLDQQIVEFCSKCKSEPLSLVWKVIIVLVIVYYVALVVTFVSSLIGLFSPPFEAFFAFMTIGPILLMMVYCRISIAREEGKKDRFYAEKRMELEDNNRDSYSEV
ncbi:MAG: hypothetical protein E4H14_18625 [Candidatus Thorarchaeota archaeon]|nr:MAG: hypothetical protein E4H14_18625 [Candidatus Thorarchaeota archaeon]